ncbi:YdhR family protein [Curvivirga sp.]|uniref:YdhR family protein n=1 Tax=Curvivirga sp. TaxID=2856848 RepID=UPI003B598A80
MQKEKEEFSVNSGLTRRKILSVGAKVAATAMTATIMPSTGGMAQENQAKEPHMKTKAFVYTEVQISVPFDQAPWRKINQAIKQQPGFISKTWLAGLNNNSLGGIYAFDSIENAKKFVTGYFPTEAGGFGAAHNTRIFDATLVEEASRDMGSPHFGIAPYKKPGAFVYTEVQVNLPFEQAPWQDRNPILKNQPGLLAKTWLTGLHTNTIGGIDAFDTVENAKQFAINTFPKTAEKMNAAFYTRIFDASLTEEASKDMYSPFYL